MSKLITNKKDDIFDVAIAINFFKNHMSSGNDMNHFSNHFLYKATYKKLLTFSKEELETKFYNDETKTFHENDKSKNHEIKWSRNILQIILQLKNPLFFMALIEKKAFEKEYNPFVKKLLRNLKSNHSLDFYEMLYFIQTTNPDNDLKNNPLTYKWAINKFCIKIDTEEKQECFLFLLNELAKKPTDLINYIIENINNFTDEHNIITKSILKKHNIDLNQHCEFNILPNNSKEKFFINGTYFETLNNLFDYGFSFNNYSFNNENLITCVLKYELDYNQAANNFAIPFLKKMLKICPESDLIQFFIDLGNEPTKLKKHGHVFELVAKERLNQKLETNLNDLPKIKQPKI